MTASGFRPSSGHVWERQEEQEVRRWVEDYHSATALGQVSERIWADRYVLACLLCDGGRLLLDLEMERKGEGKRSPAFPK